MHKRVIKHLSLILSILIVLTCSGCSTVFAMRPVTDFRSLLHLSLKSDGKIGSEEFEETLDTYTNSRKVMGNAVSLYENGDEFFPRLIAEIDSAESYIDIAMYDYTVDNIGREVLDHLIAAVNRGVAVRLTYDHFGCVTDISDFSDFTAAGGQVLTFNPLKAWTFLRMNNRNHRKIVIIDGYKAFISGLNISDSYTGNGFNGWRDSGVMITGPACYEAEKAFAQCWNQAGSNWLGMNIPFIGSNSLKRIIDYPFIKLFGNLYTPVQREIPDYGDVDIRIVEQSPEYIDSNLVNLYSIAINSAKESLYIATPYFLPPPTLRRAILDAADRGVDVRILTQDNSDLKLFRELARGEFHVYKKHDIRIWGWNRSILHNKLFIVDGKFFIGGSVNLDSRSMLMNYEVAFCSENSDLIQEYTQSFMHDLNLSEEYSYEQTRKMITDKSFIFLPIRDQM